MREGPMETKRENEKFPTRGYIAYNIGSEVFELSFF